MVWLQVGAMLLLGILVPVLVAERLEGTVHGWLLRAGRDRVARTALALVGLFAALGATLALAVVAAYRLQDEVVGGTVLLAVALPLLCVAMVFSPSSWNAPRPGEDTRAFQARGASRATAYTVYWLGFVGLVALFGTAAGAVMDLWLFRP